MIKVRLQVERDNLKGDAVELTRKLEDEHSLRNDLEDELQRLRKGTCKLCQNLFDRQIQWPIKTLWHFNLSLSQSNKMSFQNSKLFYGVDAEIKHFELLQLQIEMFSLCYR